MKKLFILLAIVMSFVAVQSVSAETVEGEITGMKTRHNVVTVDEGSIETDVYGVKYDFLENQCSIDLDLHDIVSFEVVEKTCSDGSIVLFACEVTVDQQFCSLRDCN